MILVTETCLRFLSQYPITVMDADQQAVMQAQIVSVSVILATQSKHFKQVDVSSTRKIQNTANTHQQQHNDKNHY